jgi:outer membrane cobalamin receptor
MAAFVRSRLSAHAALAVSFLLAFFVSLPACAEDPVDLDAVAVTASRISDKEGEAPPALSVVSAADIVARGATTVAEALKTVPGLSLSSRGAEGSQVAVSIRGSTTNEVLVLVDGQRVNDALTGLVDLSNIPLDNVERIEVMRGGGSSLYGGDAIGGVVNIITKRKSYPVSLLFENGSYIPTTSVVGYGSSETTQNASAASLVDSQKVAMSWGPKLGDVMLRLSGSATRADNAYTYIDSNEDQRMRQNDGLLAADASVGATMALGAGTLSADVAGTYGLKGSPGTQSTPTPDATETDADMNAVARFSAERFLSDLLSLDVSLRADYATIDYVDADDSANDGHHKISTIAGEASQRAYLSDAVTLAYGLSGSYAAASSDVFGSPTRVSSAAFAEADYIVGALSIRPSLRYDYYSDFFAEDPTGGIGAALGASYALSSLDTLKLNLSRAYRVPTFEDLYWPSLDGAEGNPDLKPETAYEANLGYERKGETFTSSTTAYIRYLRDAILWQPGDDGVWRPSNYGAALYPGIEEQIDVKLQGGYKASVNYSYLYSYVLSGDLALSDDKRLPMTPVHSLKGVLSYEGPRVTWSTTVQYASLRYLKTANVAYLSDYFTLDAIVRWKATETMSVYAAIDNLFDEQYEIVDGYPMPGTKIRLGIELKLY